MDFGALFLPKKPKGLMSRSSHILVIRFLKGSYQNTTTIYQLEPDVPQGIFCLEKSEFNRQLELNDSISNLITLPC